MENGRLARKKRPGRLRFGNAFLCFLGASVSVAGERSVTRRCVGRRRKWRVALRSTRPANYVAGVWRIASA
jgi:hypothetical protein